MPATHFFSASRYLNCSLISDPSSDRSGVSTGHHLLYKEYPIPSPDSVHSAVGSRGGQSGLTSPTLASAFPSLGFGG